MIDRTFLNPRSNKQTYRQAKDVQFQINVRFKNPILIGIRKPYNKMRIPFLEQRRGIQRKTKALIDGTFLIPKSNKQKTNKQSSTTN